MQNVKCRIQNEELKIIFVFLFNGRGAAPSRYIFDRHFIVVIFYTQNLAVFIQTEDSQSDVHVVVYLQLALWRDVCDILSAWATCALIRFVGSQGLCVG